MYDLVKLPTKLLNSHLLQNMTIY